MFQDPEAKSRLRGCGPGKSIPAKLSVRLKNHSYLPQTVRRINMLWAILFLFVTVFFILFHTYILPSSL